MLLLLYLFGKVVNKSVQKAKQYAHLIKRSSQIKINDRFF